MHYELKFQTIKQNFYPTNVNTSNFNRVIFLLRNQNVPKPTLKAKNQRKIYAREPVELDLWVNNFWKKQ